MYMILQGIGECFASFIQGAPCLRDYLAPMLWGTLSDTVGRRPITAACLLILALSCLGLALVPTSAYWLLMILRCLQAAGSASTIAVGAGVVSDISTPEERGGFFGFFILGPMVGPALGPVVGGALTQGLGWRFVHRVPLALHLSHSYEKIDLLVHAHSLIHLSCYNLSVRNGNLSLCLS